MGNRNKIIVVLLLLLAKSSVAQVVQPSFNIVRGTNSFTLGKVNSMAQDKYGYMWFADQTNKCLARYDGYHIKIYQHDPGDSNSTECEDFECITADASGNVWAGTQYGVDKFDLAKNKFIHYHYPKSEKGSGDYALLFDHKGILWMGGGDGLSSLDPVTGKFTFYANKGNDTSSLSYNVVRSLYEDKAGVLWVGTGIAFDTKTKRGGLNRFNKETGTFTRYMHDPNNPQSLISNKVRAMFEDSKGNFWVGTDGDGLHIMNRKNGTFERLTYDPLHPEKLSRPPVEKGKEYDHITFIAEDVSGKIWIGTYAEGIVCYNPGTKKLDHFNSDDKKRPRGYTDNSAWGIYISKDGVVWITDEHSDLFRVDPLQTGFSEVKMEERGSPVHFLEDSAGNLWMTLNEKGLLMVNPKSNERKRFEHNANDSFSISSDNGTLIQQGPDGQLWVGTWDGKNLFDPKTGRFKRSFYNPESNGPNQVTNAVFGLLETKDEIYFGVGIVLNVQNKNTGIITRYTNNPQDTNSISEGGVLSFVNNGDGNIWMSVFNFDNSTLELFNTRTKKFRHCLRGMIIWDVFKSTDGSIWVGTSKGLYRRNDSLDSFFHVAPEGSEFNKARVKSMTEDANKNIWGISTLGIFMFNPSKNELNIYGDKFGVFDVGVLPYEATYRANNGELFFGNPHGYYKCFPNNLVNRQPPQIVITDLKVDGHSITPGKEVFSNGPIEDAKEITLHHNQNIFSIDFAAIHFSDPENNTHQYMLEGYETAWRAVSGEKTAYYFNIPPGHYVFKVKATSSYGITSEKSIKIIVLPPWWFTWWAYTLYILLLGGAIWSFIKWRTKLLEKEKVVLEKKVTERTRELKKEKEIVETTLHELKSTQAQLIQSEKMASLGELTAGIAHEIQNPLNFVNNFSEVNNELIEELKSGKSKLEPEEQDELLDDIFSNNEKINHHGKRADAIVKGMLQHSRQTSGIKEPTGINALCDEYLRLSYHGLRAKEKDFNATMKTDFDETIGSVNIIPQDIGRVLLNLYNNAFYAVTEKNKQHTNGYEPAITVSTKKFNNKIEIRVADNGNGIPQNVLDKIFQPFFTTKPTGQGTGLGLSLSYDIIKAHGGEIRAATTEGEGTIISVELPK